MTDHDLLQELDNVAIPLTDWEIDFLESTLRHGERWRATPKQRVVLHRMADKYLDPALVAEWLSQQRLFTP